MSEPKVDLPSAVQRLMDRVGTLEAESREDIDRRKRLGC